MPGKKDDGRQRFERARKTLHWTRQVAADYLGCSKNAIYRYETEHDEFARTVPPAAVEWIERVAHEFRDVIKRHPRPELEP